MVTVISKKRAIFAASLLLVFMSLSSCEKVSSSQHSEYSVSYSELKSALLKIAAAKGYESDPFDDINTDSSPLLEMFDRAGIKFEDGKVYYDRAREILILTGRSSEINRFERALNIQPVNGNTNS